MGRNSSVYDENPTWWHLERSVQIKNTSVWETQDRIGIVQYGDSPEDSKTRSAQIEGDSEKKYRAESTTRNGNCERNAVVKNQETKQRDQRTLGDCWHWEANGQWSRGDNCSFRHDINKRAIKDIAESFSELFYAAEWEKCVENLKSQRRESQWKNVSIALQGKPQGTCTNSFCEKMVSSSMLVLQVGEWTQIWWRGSHAHRQVEEHPRKRSKKKGDKSAMAMMKRNEQHQRTGRLVLDAYSSSTRLVGLRVSGHGAAEVFIYFTEELRHAETDPICSIHQSRATSC